MVNARSRRRLTPFALAGLVTLGCVVGPFEHRNPHDPETQITVSLASNRDTLTAAQPDAVMQMVTVPVVEGYVVLWGSAKPELVASIGNGTFRRVAAPTTIDSAQVFGYFLGGRVATRMVYVLPTP